MWLHGACPPASLSASATAQETALSLDLQSDSQSAPVSAPSAEGTSCSGEVLHFESLQPGMQWLSPTREISGDDVAEFAVLTGDDDPLHTDPTAPSPFGKPVAHGLLGLSVMAGLSVDHPRVATLALVEIRGWNFTHPIFFGDQVRVRTTIESACPHGRRAGRIVWRRELLNQDDRVVQSGQIVTLVSRERVGGRRRVESEIRRDQESRSESDRMVRRSSMPPR